MNGFLSTVVKTRALQQGNAREQERAASRGFLDRVVASRALEQTSDPKIFKRGEGGKLRVGAPKPQHRECWVCGKMLKGHSVSACVPCSRLSTDGMWKKHNALAGK